jgi:hypothetical protein
MPLEKVPFAAPFSLIGRFPLPAPLATLIGNPPPGNT